MRALHTAASGMAAQELNVQVISNNIANMRTTGYKRQRAEFQDLLYQQLRRVGTQTSDQGNILPAGIEPNNSGLCISEKLFDALGPSPCVHNVKQFIPAVIAGFRSSFLGLLSFPCPALLLPLLALQLFFPLALLYAGLGAGLVSVIIGLPALRIRGLMLTVTTLSFALALASR